MSEKKACRRPTSLKGSSWSGVRPNDGVERGVDPVLRGREAGHEEHQDRALHALELERQDRPELALGGVDARRDRGGRLVGQEPAPAERRGDDQRGHPGEREPVREHEVRGDADEQRTPMAQRPADQPKILSMGDLRGGPAVSAGRRRRRGGTGARAWVRHRDREKPPGGTRCSVSAGSGAGAGGDSATGSAGAGAAGGTGPGLLALAVKTSEAFSAA